MDTQKGTALQSLIRLPPPQYIRLGEFGLTDRQIEFLMADHIPEVLYGGSAGGGKSTSLLMAALQYVDVPGYAALILRRTFQDLCLPGALMSRAAEWLTGTDAKWDGTKHSWTFPSGATLSFGYLENERDVYRYQGAELTGIFMDEAAQLKESQIRYLYSRLRKTTDIPVPLRMRFASNPGGPSHEFFRDRFIDNPIPGERVYIPSRLEDNPYLNRDEYVKNLQHLDPITRSQLLNGDWTARQPGSYFKREDMEIVPAAPAAKLAIIRGWDLAASKKGKRTAGVKLSKAANGVFYVEHVVKGKWPPAERDAVILATAHADGTGVPIVIEQEPGSGGLAQVDTLIRMLVGFRVKGKTVSGEKTVRAGPVSTQCGARNLKLVAGEWNHDFIDEAEAFGEDAEFLDQIDALSISFGEIAMVNARATVKVRIDDGSRKMVDGVQGRGFDWKEVGFNGRRS